MVSKVTEVHVNAGLYDSEQPGTEIRRDFARFADSSSEGYHLNMSVQYLDDHRFCPCTLRGSVLIFISKDLMQRVYNFPVQTYFLFKSILTIVLPNAEFPDSCKDCMV